MTPASTPERFLHRVRGAALGGLILAITVGGCGRTGGAETQTGPWDRRVALARVVVDNRTDRTLTISFRYAVTHGGRVEVGRVGPRSIAEVAPVPAQEPILLFARGEGFERVLEPRSLEIDATWTWIIADDDEP